MAGDQYYSPVLKGGNGALNLALIEKRTTEAQVNIATRRAIQKRMFAGLFDPLELQPLTRIGAEAINSTEV